MKKRLLSFAFFVVLLCSFLAFSALAEENVPQVSDCYYLVNSKDGQAYRDLVAEDAQVVCYSDIIGDTSGSQPSPFFSTFEDGAHIEIIFAEDIVVPESMASASTGILIDKAITVTFRYNGFTHCILSSGTADNNGIVVRSSGAHVRLIGTKGIDGNGTVSDVFNLPTVDATLGTCDTSGSYLDIYKTSANYLVVYKGSVYFENLRGYTTDALVFAQTYSSESAGPYEIYNCAISAVNNRAVNIGSTNSKIIKIENSYMKGLSGYSALSGSYVNNSTITGDGVHIDSWHNPGEVWNFVGCTITGTRVSTSTGRTYLCFTDCTFRDNMTWSLGGDNGGNQYLRIYTSATCEQAGTMEMKQSTNRGGENPFAEEYANFSAPALGHTGTADWAYNYAGDKYLSTLNLSKGCTRCGLWEPQEYVIGAMFQVLGYSAPEYSKSCSITFGIKINKSAISQYEEITGAEVDFGFAVATKACIGEGVCPLDQNGNAVVLERGNVIKASVAYSKNIYADLKISLSESNKGTDLLMSFYILDKKDSSLEISYAQSNGIVKNNSFAYISYNNH